MRFFEIMLAILKDSRLPTRFIQTHKSQRNFTENLFKFIVITVATDGLAPLGARPSAGTLITKYESCIYIGPALEGAYILDQHFKVIRPYCILVILSYNPPAYVIKFWRVINSLRPSDAYMHQ